MIVKSNEFKNACQEILSALDTKKENEVLFARVLELIAEGTTLRLNVTNLEYYVTKVITLDEAVAPFRAAVDAKKFLNLVAKITTDTIELICSGNTLVVNCNGEYKLPMIYNNDLLVSLPEITIDTVTDTVVVPNEALQSIVTYNTKELARSITTADTADARKRYYIDKWGCVTATSGCCVNSFTTPLQTEIRLAIKDEIVKLFKLFKNTDAVTLTLGTTTVGTIEHKRLKLTTDTTELAVMLEPNMDDLIRQIPVARSRELVGKALPYTIEIEKQYLLEAIGRILLVSNTTTIGEVTVSGDSLILKDLSRENSELLTLCSNSNPEVAYTMKINLKTVEKIVSGTTATNSVISFGNNKHVLFKNNNVIDFIGEVVTR